MVLLGWFIRAVVGAGLGLCAAAVGLSYWSELNCTGRTGRTGSVCLYRIISHITNTRGSFESASKMYYYQLPEIS